MHNTIRRTMWWILVGLFTLTTAYINPKCTDVSSFLQFLDKCKYEEEGRIMNCTDLPLLRFGPDIVKENVEVVYVEKCCMAFIPENTFQDARKLRYLDASHNLMRTLKHGVFRSTPQLEHLDVGYNFIETLDRRTFIGLNQLSHLDLSENLLQSLDYLIFDELKMLSNLDMSYNRLDALDYRIFQSTPELSRLNLTNNLLNVLDWRIFEKVNKISHLNLSSNNVEILDYRIFSSNVQLSQLDLSLNFLEILDRRLFNNLKALEHLNLRNNKLSSLQDSNLFTAQGQLATLLLGHNNVSTIDVKVLKPLMSIKMLDLSANPFLCDCELYPTTLWSESKALDTNTSCGNPTEFKDMPWKTICTKDFCPEVISEEEPTENFSIELIVSITLACLVLCAIVCVSAFLWKRRCKARSHVDRDVRRRDLRVENSRMYSFVYDDVGGDYYETIGIENASSPFYLKLADESTNSEQYDDDVFVDPKESCSYVEPGPI